MSNVKQRRKPREIGGASARIRARAAERKAKYGLVATCRDRPTQAAPSLALGIDTTGLEVKLPERVRLTHAHIVGATGSGKSKLIEHCIRHDIIQGHGVCVVDPHGGSADGLYRSTLGWLNESGFARSRIIHLIDPNAVTHTVGFNPLARPDVGTDLSVIAGVTLEAVERAWGGEDTQSKPNIRRVLTTTFKVLAELGLTLVEARYLFDREDRYGLRAFALQRIQDEDSRLDLERLDALAYDERSRRDFNMEVVGPINRIAEFVSSSAIRAIVGQRTRTIDLRAAMDQGQVILVNLQGGNRAHDTQTELLGRLLTRLLFFHAKRRSRWDRPFFLYLDECQRYLSGELDNILAEVRKYGVGTVLAHQWLRQLGETDDATRAAILNAPTSKIVFRATDPKEAEELALATIPLELERVKHALDKPTVVKHHRTKLASTSTADIRASTASRTEAEGVTVGEMYGSATVRGEGSSELTGQTMLPDETSGWFSAPTVLLESKTKGTTQHTGTVTSESEMYSKSLTRARGDATTRGVSTTKGEREAFEPIYETLPTATYSKEEELYRAAQLLLGLPQAHCVAAFMSGTGRLTRAFKVPHVESCAYGEQEFAALQERVLERSPSATRTDEALREIEQRKRLIAQQLEEGREPKSPRGFRTKKKRGPKGET